MTSPREVKISTTRRALELCAVALAKASTGGGERGDTRERILEAAFGRFACFGFYGTSIRDLTRDVEIVSAGFYAHFSSKEDLLTVALARGYSEYLRSVPLATDHSSTFTCRAALRDLCSRHMEFASAQTSAIRLANDLLRDELEKLVDPSVAGVVRDAQRSLIELFTSLINGARLEVGMPVVKKAGMLADVVINLCEAHITSPRPGNDFQLAPASARLDLIEHVAIGRPATP